MAKKDFRNGLQSRLNDLEVKVEDMADGALQSDEIACDTLTAASIRTTDIRLVGVGGNVLEVKQDDETPATATLDDTGALEVTALTIGGEAVVPGTYAPPAQNYEIESFCGSDAATSGVAIHDNVPLLWWRNEPGSLCPPNYATLMGKAIFSVVRPGDSSPLSCVAEVPFAVVHNEVGGLDVANIAFGDAAPASGVSNPISSFSVIAWSGNDDDYSVLVLRVKRTTTADIAPDLVGGTGPYAPYPFVVDVLWAVPPVFAGDLVEGTDYGYGAPPDWPATRAELADLVGAGTAIDPLLFWKLMAPIAAGTYEEGATITLSDLLLDPSTNAVPWYATEVRVRLAVSGGADANVGAWVAREVAHTAFATLDPAAVALIGLDNPFDIYVEYKAPNTAAEVKGDFAQSTLVASGGGP